MVRTNNTNGMFNVIVVETVQELIPLGCKSCAHLAVDPSRRPLILSVSEIGTQFNAASRPGYVG